MTDQKPSKSSRKRETLALQALGERLVGLTPAHLAAIPLGDDIRDAVLEAQRIKAHGALRRQRQLIGKLMRDVDPEPIRAALSAIDAVHMGSTRTLHLAEEWRERLANGQAEDLQAFQALTGRDNPELGRLCAALSHARHADEQKRLRRQLFRQIHADLDAKMQSGGG